MYLNHGQIQKILEKELELLECWEGESPTFRQVGTSCREIP